MGTAFEITCDDVSLVLKSHNHRGASDPSYVAHCLDVLDTDQTEKMALCGHDIEEQTNYAHDDIATQLQIAKLLLVAEDHQGEAYERK